MNKNLDIISYAVSLLIKAAIIAGQFSGKARKRSLKRLAAMDIDTKGGEKRPNGGQEEHILEL